MMICVCRLQNDLCDDLSPVRTTYVWKEKRPVCSFKTACLQLWDAAFHSSSRRLFHCLYSAEEGQQSSLHIKEKLHPLVYPQHSAATQLHIHGQELRVMSKAVRDMMWSRSIKQSENKQKLVRGDRTAPSVWFCDQTLHRRDAAALCGFFWQHVFKQSDCSSSKQQQTVHEGNQTGNLHDPADPSRSLKSSREQNLFFLHVCAWMNSLSLCWGKRHQIELQMSPHNPTLQQHRHNMTWSDL